MKNNYKLKIICLLCAVTAAFSSCKKNELAEEKGLSGNHKNLAVAGDGKWDLLGHGYDITGEIFERKHTSKVSIFDLTRFYADYPTRIVTPTDTKGGYNVYYGANAYDYIKDVNSKQKFGVTRTVGDKDSGLYGTSNFSLTNDNQSTYTYNGKYSYATYESWYRIKSIDFTDDVTTDLLKNYLTPDFLAYLSNYSAEQIVQTYGTHILLGIDIGGRLKYDYKGSIVKETTYEQKLRAVKAGFSIGIAKIFSIDLSADVSKEEKTTISNETTEKLFAGTFYGGNNSGTSFSGDALGNTSESISLISWQQSINSSNASLIGINRSVPIYEFITDPVKKQQVKDAVERYIESRQIKIIDEPTTPQPILNPLKNGWLIETPDGRIYSVMDGRARHIHDPGTLEAVFIHRLGFSSIIKKISSLASEGLSEGPPITPGAELLHDTRDGKVYLFEYAPQGVYLLRHIANPDVANTYHFKISNARKITSTNGYSIGAQIQ